MFLLTVTAIFISAGALAHGGGIDSFGCHRDRSADEYHCHQGDYAGHRLSSRADALRIFGGRKESSDSNLNTLAYDRDPYGGWIDADGDCQDTREEVLIAQAVEYRLDASGCHVVSGVWVGPYTGKRITDPGDLHIDHVVSLKEAHSSGAAAWGAAQRQEFANDFDNLLAVDASENLSKGSGGPEDWLPDVGRCAFIDLWISVKSRWNLDVDARELAMLEHLAIDCD